MKIKYGKNALIMLLVLLFASCPNEGEDTPEPPASPVTLIRITITKLPTKRIYNKGESFDSTGIEVTGTYSDGTEKGESVTSSNFSGFVSSSTGSPIITVTIQGKTAVFSVFVVGEDIITNIDDIAPYLQNALGGNVTSSPVKLALGIDLAGTYLPTVISIINNAGKYVALDLSKSTMGESDEFDPGNGSGAARVVSLVLPAVAKSIKDGNLSIAKFSAFTNLESVNGAEIITVGNYTFRNCTKLTTLILPKATNIGSYAFSGCTGLISLDMPKVENIGGAAFSGCTSLANVTLPVAASISSDAFSSCINLSNVSLPKATAIYEFAFSGCINLSNVSLPKASSIGSYAFEDCTSIVDMSLPASTSINDFAFDGCTNLATVNLSGATTSIGNYAFNGCTRLSTISLPASTPPALGENVFAYTYRNTDSPGTITITVPQGKKSTYTESWGVSAETGAADNNTGSKYGSYHKAITIAEKAEE